MPAELCVTLLIIIGPSGTDGLAETQNTTNDNYTCEHKIFEKNIL